MFLAEFNLGVMCGWAAKVTRQSLGLGSDTRPCSVPLNLLSRRQ
jgi:hypothetical protein